MHNFKHVVRTVLNIARRTHSIWSVAIGREINNGPRTYTNQGCIHLQESPLKKNSQGSCLVPNEVSRTIQLKLVPYVTSCARVTISASTPLPATLLPSDSSDQSCTARGRPRGPPVDPALGSVATATAGGVRAPRGCACRGDNGSGGRCRPWGQAGAVRVLFRIIFARQRWRRKIGYRTIF